MGDGYSLQSVLKKKKGQPVSEDIAKEAAKLEEKNYDMARQAREQLEHGAIKQKATTEQMERQGETLKHAKRSAVGVNVNAERGSELADDLEREGNFFNCDFPCIRAIKRWFSRDRDAEKMRNAILSEKGSSASVGEVEEAVMDSDEEEIVPGQKKTDRELYGVLNIVRNIRSEADKQSKEAERQKTDVQEISRINSQSEKVIRKADAHIKRI